VEALPLQRLLVLLGHALELGAVRLALAGAGHPAFSNGTEPLRQLDSALARLGVAGCELITSPGRAVEARHCPLLVEYDGGCWVLLALRDGLAVLDNGNQRLELPRDRLDAARVLWIKPPPTKAATAADNPHPARRLLVQALLRRRRVVAEVVVATLLTSLLTIASGLFSQQVYDRVVPSFAYATLWALVAIMGTLMVFDFALRVVRARMLDRVACDIDDEVSSEVFRALGDVRLDARPRSIGTLAAQVGGLESARAFFTSSVLFTLAEIPFALIFIAIIAMIGGPIAWVYVVAAAVALVVGVVSQARIKRLAGAQQVSMHARNGLLVEAIAGSETIKALGAGWRFADRWRSISHDILGSARQLRSVNAVASSLATSLSNQAYLAMMVFGVYLIEAGQITVGALTAIAMLGSRVVGPISSGIMLLTQAHSARLAMQAVDGVLRLPPEREPGLATLRPPQLGARIALDGVRFGYGEGPTPQVDIDSFQLSEGDRVVLLGPPGSGKSTLLRLLAGLYRPSAGRVTLGGIDMQLLDAELVRRAVSLLPQEVQLFRGSLRDNLAMGSMADDARLLDVTRALGLDSLVAEHPRGLDRPIAEGGSGMSVGQRQLCGMARAVMRKPRVLLLDEPSSALDPMSEKRLYEALQYLLEPRDVLVVATHRPGAATLCTRAVVMQQGRIVGDGDRAALIARLRTASAPAPAEGATR